jgi:CDP-6-deoxy-D-xylo-4-hexulose-3-dehydrase
MQYNWPLQVDPFGYLDRFKICSYLLNKSNRLTMGPLTKKLEKTLGEYADFTLCLATTSGSTANALLFDTFLTTNNFNPIDVTVFVPAVTWISSITPITTKGMKIKMIDINLEDFSFDYKKLETAIRVCDTKVKVLWPTYLIGNPANLRTLQYLAKTYDCFLFADACEATIGDYDGKQLLSSVDMVTTSGFLAHYFCGVELGLLFFKDFHYYENALMLRSHGLARNLSKSSPRYRQIILNNPDLDPEFLFVNGGTNYRLSDVHAAFALQDFKRIGKYEKHRRKIWEYFLNGLDDRFLSLNPDIVPFCLPIIKNKNIDSDLNIKDIKQKCKDSGIEVRGVVSGDLSLHPYFKQFTDGEFFENARWLNDNGFYVGIHSKVTKGMIDKLLKIIL